MTRTHPPRPRVPVEHRVLGLDRRSLPYALTALAIWALWTVVVPGVNAAVPWDDPIRAGDTIRLSETVTFTPAVGWGLQEGLRTGDTTESRDTTTGGALLVGDGVQFQVRTGPWSGPPLALLQQITKITTTVAAGQGFHVTGGTSTIQARTGENGALETFATPRGEGVIAAFVFEGTGVQIQAVGPAAQMAAQAGTIEEMITSVGDERARP